MRFRVLRRPGAGRREAPWDRDRTGKDEAMPRGWFYELGRLSAPHVLKAQWMWQTVAGSDDERWRAEFALGCVLAGMYEKEHRVDDNPDLARRLHGVCGALTGRLRNRERRFRVRVVRTPGLNAVALPGGFVFITTPLMQGIAGDDDALAFLVAHEVAHVIKGHAGGRFINALVLRLASRHGVRGGPVGQALAALLGKGLEQGYSRHQETEADRFAVRLTRSAGFDPRGGIRLMERLSRERPGQKEWGAYLLSTHPTLEARIAEINRLL